MIFIILITLKELVKTIITNSKNGYLYFLTDKEIPGFEIHSDSFNYFKNSFKGNYELEQLSNNSNAEKTLSLITYIVWIMKYIPKVIILIFMVLVIYMMK